MTISWAEFVPVVDPSALSYEQLTKAEDIFEGFREKKLKPAYLADADPNQGLLDGRVVCDLPGFNEEIYIAVRRAFGTWGGLGQGGGLVVLER